MRGDARVPRKESSGVGQMPVPERCPCRTDAWCRRRPSRPRFERLGPKSGTSGADPLAPFQRRAWYLQCHGRHPATSGPGTHPRRPARDGPGWTGQRGLARLVDQGQRRSPCLLWRSHGYRRWPSFERPDLAIGYRAVGPPAGSSTRGCQGSAAVGSANKRWVWAK